MRSGVLSDQAIKERYPEMFPVDLGGQEFLHNIILDKHIFTGIKPGKRYKKNISRFPVNDLANFATFAAPARTQQAQFDAIMNYRKSIGSSNYPQNLETAYSARLSDSYTPTLPKSAQSNSVQVPATLSLGRGTHFDAMRNEVQMSEVYISDRMRTTLSNVTEDTTDIVRSITPGGFNPKGGMLSDEYILNKLNVLYRDSPEELNTIERAYHASGKDHLGTIGN